MKANRTKATEFMGVEAGDLPIHTRMAVTVRSATIVDRPSGQMVLVTATMGESEANKDVVIFHMTIGAALEADIIERVE